MNVYAFWALYADFWGGRGSHCVALAGIEFLGSSDFLPSSHK